jgi:hypothetical protein
MRGCAATRPRALGFHASFPREHPLSLAVRPSLREPSSAFPVTPYTVTLPSGVMMWKSSDQSGGSRLSGKKRCNARSIPSLMDLGQYITLGRNFAAETLRCCRACVGRNLASMELLIIISSVFRRYDIVLEDPNKKVRVLVMVIRI